ncbi:MAG: hypothetical protein L0221_08585 [Chloroflexi bacterium]|nr:hypothetical protein [Chloroflexota bacterium]
MGGVSRIAGEIPLESDDQRCVDRECHPLPSIQRRTAAQPALHSSDHEAADAGSMRCLRLRLALSKAARLQVTPGARELFAVQPVRVDAQARALDPDHDRHMIILAASLAITWPVRPQRHTTTLERAGFVRDR